MCNLRIDPVEVDEVRRNGRWDDPDYEEERYFDAMDKFNGYQALRYVVYGGRLTRYHQFRDGDKTLDLLERMACMAEPLEKNSKNPAVQIAANEIVTIAGEMSAMLVADELNGITEQIMLEGLCDHIGVICDSKWHMVGKCLVDMMFDGYGVNKSQLADEMYYNDYYHNGEWFYDDRKGA